MLSQASTEQASNETESWGTFLKIQTDIFLNDCYY